MPLRTSPTGIVTERPSSEDVAPAIVPVRPTLSLLSLMRMIFSATFERSIETVSESSLLPPSTSSMINTPSTIDTAVVSGVSATVIWKVSLAVALLP